MTVVSLTFHTLNHRQEEWENYLHTEFPQMIENLFDVDKYMLADVESEMIAEGKNTNLLLFFDSVDRRDDFLGIELKNISERLEQKFGEDVMLFRTLLHPRNSRI
ncbi:DUF4286 family protein [Kaistella palustris]|uniref:DUF4286 family protein n=1 Tax=Kaistella palustris TaxID=493376 RepID=UPI000409BDBE|nr:DUF4286 family protein [Kaistella palustris]